MKLPQDYTKLNATQRRLVREEYVRQQNDNCMYCGASLDLPPPERITSKSIDWDLFPPHFLKHRVHLQHNHDTGMTEGAVHAYCNAVMWQYEGR
jgi:hypothetical protein